MAQNFAASKVGQRDEKLEDFSITQQPTLKIFDAAQNTDSVINSVLAGNRPHDLLLYHAALAIQRGKDSTEKPEQWAERLAASFFSDLDE